MMALIAHELRATTRRTAWPVVIALHLTTAALFIAAWGPTNGVPLWSAPLLTQLVAADRLLLAVLLTWLVTPLLSPDTGADLPGWSAVAGVTVTQILRARAIAAAVLAVTLVLVITPIAVAAAQMSGPASPSVFAAVAEMTSFALLTVGVTAISAAAWRDPLAVWSGSMAVTGIAAFGLRLLTSGSARIALALGVAAIGLAIVTAAARHRFTWTVEAVP